MSGHVAQVGRPVHDESRPGRRATLPGVTRSWLIYATCKDCNGFGHPPGDATARREAQIPVTEDWEARGAAKSTLRHALPVRFDFFQEATLEFKEMEPDPSADANHLGNVQHVDRGSKENRNGMKVTWQPSAAKLSKEALNERSSSASKVRSIVRKMRTKLSLHVEHPD